MLSNLPLLCLIKQQTRRCRKEKIHVASSPDQPQEKEYTHFIMSASKLPRSSSNNNHRGNRSGGNVRKVSVYEALYNQSRGAIDATGMSKSEVISRMKEGNVGPGQMELFVSDLFSAQPQEQKPKEESWSQVPKKNTSHQGAGISGQRGGGAMCDDRGDCGRSASNRTMGRSVRNNDNNHNDDNNHNKHNKRGTRGSRSGLDKQGRDRNTGPTATTKAKVTPAKIKIAAAAAAATFWVKGSKILIERHKEHEKKRADAKVRAIAIASGSAAREAAAKKMTQACAKARAQAAANKKPAAAKAQAQAAANKKAAAAAVAAAPTAAVLAPPSAVKAPAAAAVLVLAAPDAAKTAAAKKQSVTMTAAKHMLCAATKAANAQKENLSKGINMGKWAQLAEPDANFSFGDWGDDKDGKKKEMDAPACQIIVLGCENENENEAAQCILCDSNLDSESCLNSIKKDGNFLRDESSHKASPGDGASKEECGKEEGEKKRVSIIYFL